MDKKLKKKWVAALRGGEYLQGHHALNKGDEGRFCCLGVLCDISGLGKWKKSADGLRTYVVGDDATTYGLSLTVMEAAGLDGGDETALMVANDVGHSFAEIADFIEDCL